MNSLVTNRSNRKPATECAPGSGIGERAAAVQPESGPPINPPLSAAADPHLARSYVDRFDVGCAGDFIDSFPYAAAALRFARWSAEVTGCPHEILDAKAKLALLIVDPPEAA